MDIWQYILIGGSGLLAGVLGGLLGVGGSVVMIPALLWILGTSFTGLRGTHYPEAIHQYQAAAMIVNFVLVIPSLPIHRRRGAVWTGVWRCVVPAALLGITAGVFLSYWGALSGENASRMRYLMGAFFLYVAAANVKRLVRSGPAERDERLTVEAKPWWRKAGVGFPMGLLAGLLGIGGGAVAVPAQQIILNMPLRAAIGTSAATILSISWVGAILKNVQLGDNGWWGNSLMLAALLTPTAMIGSYLGGHLTHRLPLKVVRLAFIVLMVVSAGKIFLG